MAATITVQNVGVLQIRIIIDQGNLHDGQFIVQLKNRYANWFGQLQETPAYFRDLDNARRSAQITLQDISDAQENHRKAIQKENHNKLLEELDEAFGKEVPNQESINEAVRKEIRELKERTEKDAQIFTKEIDKLKEQITLQTGQIEDLIDYQNVIDRSIQIQTQINDTHTKLYKELRVTVSVIVHTLSVLSKSLSKSSGLNRPQS